MGDKPKLRRKIRRLDQEEKKKHKRVLSASVGKAGMWPLNAPGMPPPGPDFLRAAQLLGDSTEYVKGTKAKPAVYEPGDKLRELYRRALREPGFTLEVSVKQGVYDTVTFVPGHIWGQHAAEWAKSMVDLDVEPPKVDGPHPADVFVLGKMPWKEETAEGRNLIGATGEILVDVINKLHIKNAGKWYISNLCKFAPPNEGRDLKAGWIQDCLPLLHQELRIVRPKYILCLGADASKALLGDKFNVSYMAGRVVPYSFETRIDADDESPPHTCHVMTVIHPVNVVKDPAQARILESNMGRFANLLATNNLDLEEKGLDHRSCMVLEDALDWIEEAQAELYQQPEKLRLTAWDLEWQGQHPVNDGSYVRTIQCSWGDKKAMCFVLHHPGGKVAFRDRDGKPAIKRLVKALNEFVKCSRPVGHFLVADLEWAESLGLKLIDHCPIPLTDRKGKLAWERFRAGRGWLDTAYMNHAIEETAPLGLEVLTMRYTMAPRYDIELEDWKAGYVKEKKLKKEGLEGYGDCPDKILIPYANYDADVTRRIALSLLPMLDEDYEGNCCWEAFWESMIIQKAILRIHQNGIRADRARIDEHTKNFITWRAKKEQEIQAYANWPEFNIRSVQQVREFLFGEHLNGKKTPDGKPVQIRPEGAKSLYIEPLLDTSKPPRRWKDLVAKGLHWDASPGTGKMVLGILAQENLHKADEINMIRDYRFLDQVLKSVLRMPKVDEEDHWIENDDGFLEYEAGLAYSIDDDGRVRTHLYPTAETGRWKSSRPNLQNISKSRDPDYVRLLGGEKNEKGQWVGGDYTHSLRSVLRASDGYAFVEADYKGAELYGMALMSGSKKMQDHCLRSLLDDEGYDEHGNKVDGGKFPHPDYYDIHSNVAVLAFHLKCHPSKHGLKEIGKVHFRTLAKNVIFGIAYGRQAKAIALQAKEQGINVTPQEAQMVIDAIFAMYPELVPFFNEAKDRAKNARWLCHCFGRFRRFPRTSDYKLEGEFERQAMNFPIQGMIASAVDRGLAHLVARIEELGLEDDIRILLTIHDAVLLEAKYEYVDFAKQLIQWAFVDMVEIWPTNLAGEPRGDGPYHLGMDFEVSKHWGEKFSYEEAVKVGLDPKFAKKPKTPAAPEPPRKKKKKGVKG
jgi:uracil-DNA glycosylase family 4